MIEIVFTGKRNGKEYEIYTDRWIDEIKIYDSNGIIDHESEFNIFGFRTLNDLTKIFDDIQIKDIIKEE